MDTNPTYGKFAQVYEELMDEVPYDEWCDQIEAYIRQYGISVPASRSKQIVSFDQTVFDQTVFDQTAFDQTAFDQTAFDQTAFDQTSLDQTDPDSPLLQTERNLVVDLGCGTGKFTRLLAEKGYDVIGVDNSEEMLAIATTKTKEEGADILYLLQDMRELDLYSTVGTVVSVCDSLNYMVTDEDLLTVFERVNTYLYSGGIFIFDFNTVYKYEYVIGDTVIAENRSDCSFIWENVYDPESRCNEYDLTLFVQEEDGRYNRFQETHCQRGYTLEEMVTLLQQTGMEILETKDADTHGAVTPQSERIYVVAKGSK
jgi:SAM-dependent methyltransferase